MTNLRRVDEILEVDAANARAAIEILQAFDGDLLKAFETVGELFHWYNKCAGAAFSARDARSEQQLEAIAKDGRLSSDDLIARIEAGDPEHVRARALWQSLGAHPQQFVLLLLHRYFRWGLASLLYLRVTPVLGYQRMQAEAVALLRLFDDEPSRAEQWMRTGLSDSGGRKFFSQTRGAVVQTMERYRLAGEYERGSAAYQHVRVNRDARALDHGRGHPIAGPGD